MFGVCRGCGSCNALRWHNSFQQWLCDMCFHEAESMTRDNNEHEDDDE